MTKDKREKLIILGSGLFAEEIADYISKFSRYEILGFVEGIDRTKCKKSLLGYPVLWIEDVGKLSKSCKAVCAVGSTKRKGFIAQALNLGVKFVSIIHPAAHVSGNVRLGEGTTVGPGAVIATNTRIGSHVIINRGCLIGHHVEIGDYVTISPGANIAGKAILGDLCYIGMGALVLDGILVGNNSVVGAGSVVTKDVPESVQVVGIPARISKEIEDK